MSIWGKIIGGAAGFAMGGPLGALIGAAAGHAVDRLGTAEVPIDEEASTRKAAFTIGVIALAAKMAKADGVVTRDEIAAQEVVQVPPEEVKNVGRVWDMARRDVNGYEAYAQQIAKLFNPGSPVLEKLIGTLFHIAKADGVIHENEITYLKRVSAIFGFSEMDFDCLQAVFGDGKVDSPYSVLGIEPTAKDTEVKSAYRALVREATPIA